MKNEFIPYEQALELKELGFDEECFGYYDIDKGYTNGYAFCYSDVKSQLKNGCSAPLYQQTFRWFMDRYKLYGIIIPTITMHWTFKMMTVTHEMVEVSPYEHVDSIDYNLYESAELACIKRLIKIAKNK